MAFKEGDAWKRRGAYLGRNKEVFDAEIYAIHQAMTIINERNEAGIQYTIFSDSQAAIGRV